MISRLIITTNRKNHKISLAKLCPETSMQLLNNTPKDQRRPRALSNIKIVPTSPFRQNQRALLNLYLDNSSASTKSSKINKSSKLLNISKTPNARHNGIKISQFFSNLLKSPYKEEPIILKYFKRAKLRSLSKGKNGNSRNNSTNLMQLSINLSKTPKVGKDYTKDVFKSIHCNKYFKNERPRGLSTMIVQDASFG